MDDVVIFSRTFEEHITLLRSLFEKLRKSGIQLKGSKCRFGFENVEFLGFESSCSGLKPQERLTDAIRKFATLKKRKETRRFLGISGFYRDFIQDYATINKPFTELTSVNVPFILSKECEEAFNLLKNKQRRIQGSHSLNLIKNLLLKLMQVDSSWRSP